MHPLVILIKVIGRSHGRRTVARQIGARELHRRALSLQTVAHGLRLRHCAERKHVERRNFHRDARVDVLQNVREHVRLLLVHLSARLLSHHRVDVFDRLGIKGDARPYHRHKKLECRRDKSDYNDYYICGDEPALILFALGFKVIRLYKIIAIISRHVKPRSPPRGRGGSCGAGALHPRRMTFIVMYILPLKYPFCQYAAQNNKILNTLLTNSNYSDKIVS